MAIFSCIMYPANIKPFSDCVLVLNEISETLHVISTYTNGTCPISYRNVSFHEIFHISHKNAILFLLEYLRTQFKMMWYLLLHSREIDICVFYIGDAFVLPITFAKLLSKKTVLILGGSIEKEIELNASAFGWARIFVKKINLFLVDSIVVYSPRLIHNWNLVRYSNKITVAHKHFIDFSKFKINNNIDSKLNLIGYVGRLSQEKGVMNFVKSIPLLLEQNNDLRFILIGDGELYSEIKEFLCNNNLNSRATLQGWVPHGKLPDYFNELKLIVLPSYTEGLPNIMLEAMACGTIVLTTSVGSIPDIIIDGESGILLKNNSPECIAKSIIDTLNNIDLSRMAINAELLVKRNFAYEVAVKMFADMFERF